MNFVNNRILRKPSNAPSDIWSDLPSDAIIETRIKYGKKKDAIFGILMEYSKKSSIHGIYYLWQRRRPMRERIFWIIVFALAILMCSFSIYNVYKRWSNFPLIVSFDTTAKPIQTIPFPSIIICPQQKSDRTMFNFTEVYKKILKNNFSLEHFPLDEEESNIFAAMLHICDPPDFDKLITLMREITNNDFNIEDVLENVMNRQNDTHIVCLWDSQFYECRHVQRYVITEEGVCYQFNGLNPNDLYNDESLYNPLILEDYQFDRTLDGQKKELSLNYSNSENWSLENGYKLSANITYPLRTKWAGIKKAFKNCVVYFKSDFDLTCIPEFQGSKVAVLAPDEVIGSMDNYIFLPIDREIVLCLTPRYITTANNLRSYDPHVRQCYYSSERNLKYFKIYNQKNCEFECMTNYTILKCGCRAFYMPNVPDVQICDIEKIKCYKEAKNEWNFQVYRKSIQGLIEDCDCLPACFNLKYDIELSDGIFDIKPTIEAHKTWSRSDITGSRLTIFFKERQFTSIVQTEYYGISGLIAYIGGTFSLYMGFSIISLVELIYFISIRLYSNLKMRKSKIQKRKVLKTIQHIE